MIMELRENCELVEVVYKNENEKAVMTFLDVDHGQVLEVIFNKQSYDNGKFIDDPKKAEQVDKWCEEHFGVEFDDLSSKIGTKKDIYAYDNFNSLWESTVTRKFTTDDKGKFFQTTIGRVVDDGFGIHIYFMHAGDEYESKMMYSDYIENLRQWFVNPQKKKKQSEKFKELFGVEAGQSETIIGKPIAVEVKVAFKTHAYCEIKKPEWA